MRVIEVERVETATGTWIIVQTTRYRRGKPPLVKRTYWTPDEFARIVELVRQELSPSTSAGEPSQPP